MLVDSLRELLDTTISNPIEQNRRICAAIFLIAAKLDADTGVTDTDYQDSANDASSIVG